MYQQQVSILPLSLSIFLSLSLLIVPSTDDLFTFSSLLTRLTDCLTRIHLLTVRTRDKQLQTAAQPLSDAGPTKSKAMSSAPKQNLAKKKGPWGEDYLLTNPKSALVHADLVVCISVLSDLF